MYKNFAMSFGYTESENTEQILIDGDISKTLTKYATDSNPETRQEFARTLSQILRQQPLEDILSHIHDLTASILLVAEDKTPSVRTSLVEQIPYIFLQCHEHAYPDLENYLYDRLLQIILDYLKDDECEVRREAYSALQLLLEKYVLDKKRIEEKVCPAIICPEEKIHHESFVEFNINSITLMGKITPIIGQQKTEDLFLNHFVNMCKCKMNSVRRTCATVFPVICFVLGVEITENNLLDVFFLLCEDVFWGVRKACAESVALISLVCSPSTRKLRIAPVVFKLSKDNSKWVVGATFKILGQFISSFADPCITGLTYLYNGELHITNPVDSDFREHSDPQLVTNYDYYLNMFANSDIIGNEKNTEGSVSNSFDDEKLTAEEISNLIAENKNKLVKQINDAVYIKRNIYKNVVFWGDTWDRFLDNNNKIDEYPKTTTESSNNSNSPFIGYIDLNTTSTVTSNECLSANNNNTDVINGNNNSKEVETEDNSWGVEFEDKDNKLINTTGDISNNLNQNSNISETKPRRRSTVLVESSGLRRKNIPTGLPLIIKQAISDVEQQFENKTPTIASRFRTIVKEHKEKPKQNLVQKTASCDSGMANLSAEDISKMFENLSIAASSQNHGSIQKNFSKSEDEFSDRTIDTGFQSSFEEEDDETFREFNSHTYWQIDPDLPLDFALVDPQYETKWFSHCSSNNTDCDANLTPSTSEFNDFTSSTTNAVSKFKPPEDYEQNIVPPGILESYVTMILYEEDEEIKLNCAYNFPAVALTIGKSNWHILRALLQYLCDDIDWKVRKTIALSIDLLAMILGKEIATRDLVPIYLGFFKDLDEVKIEAIRNFANFLKAIEQRKHEEILSNIGICLRIDSKTNWRIKEDLAKQICIIIKMYNSINNHSNLLFLTSLTSFFLEDKVSCVREIAAEAITEIIIASQEKHRDAIMKHFLVQEFVNSDNWRKRQIFLFIFYKLITSKKPLTVLSSVFPSIKRLSYDSVPNIRLLVAKNLIQIIFVNVFDNIFADNSEDIVQMMKRLQNDEDRDVREVFYSVDHLKIDQQETDYFATNEHNNQIENIEISHNENQKNSGSSLPDEAPNVVSSLKLDDDAEAESNT